MKDSVTAVTKNLYTPFLLAAKVFLISTRNLPWAILVVQVQRMLQKTVTVVTTSLGAGKSP